MRKVRKVFLVVFVFLLVATPAFAQQDLPKQGRFVTLNLDGAPLKQFLTEMAKDCGFDFLPDPDIRDDQKITARVNQDRVCSQVLADVLYVHGLYAKLLPSGVYYIMPQEKYEREARDEAAARARAQADARRQQEADEARKAREARNAPPAPPVAPFQVVSERSKRSDVLGLESQTIAAGTKIPVVCASAVEASKLPYVYGIYFGGDHLGSGDSLRYSSPIGNVIQGGICDALLVRGYSPVASNTGFQAASRSAVRTEISVAAAAEIPEYVVIPEVAFTTLNGNRRIVDPRLACPGVEVLLGGRVGSDCARAGTVFGRGTDSRTVEAVLTVRFYDRYGRQVRTYRAAEKMDWKQGEEFRLVLIQTSSTMSPSLAPLAQKLVAAVADKMR